MVTPEPRPVCPPGGLADLQGWWRYLAAIVESSEDAIITKDLEGIITTWNASAQRIFGYTAREAVGNPITILIPSDRLDEEPASCMEKRRDG